MMVTYNKYFDTERKRIEFLLCNFDYFDGIDYLSKAFSEKYGFSVTDEIDGIWYKIIRISLQDCIYELSWYEETGNTIYCMEQTENANKLLEERLKEVITVVNKRLNLSE